MGCANSKKTDRISSPLKTKSPQNHKFKIVFLGNASVGKTSIAARYCSNNSAQDYGPTVGGVYYKKEISSKSGDYLAQSIWDTAGEQKYRSMASLYYRDADVILLVFDLSDPVSFKELDYWVGELEFRVERQNLPVIVVGNKADLPKRQVSQQQIKIWLAQRPSFNYLECSASTGEGVKQIFDLASEQYLKRIQNSTK